MTTGFSECCLNRSMHDAIHPRSGGLRSCSFGSVPELRGFVQLPLDYLIAGRGEREFINPRDCRRLDQHCKGPLPNA